MKKVIFAIAISALVLASCGTSSTPAESPSVDSIKVHVDSVAVDTTLAKCCSDSAKK